MALSRTSTTGKYADFEALREQAVALRRSGLSRRQIRDELKIHNNDILNRLLQGEPPPEWTKRPNAKDDLRARARELRLQGWTYDRIEAELGCSRSSVSLWVRDLPKPERKRSSEEASAIARRGWEAKLLLREEERQDTKDRARQEVGTLSPRELFLVGVGLYWAEGTKDKPHARREQVTFVNSDPGVISTFLAWLDLMEVDRALLRFSVMIHETADVAGAERYWADLTGAGPSQFNKTTLKRHNPKTVRKNTGESYRGCLVIKVLKSADLYRRIEGSWYGIVCGAAHRQG
ncbi:helix-turn-helix domain-containing protein [Streptomyces griseoaurantiacus]|uniref:Putative ATPase subunit of terminase (GpP-like) n=1 Tax=Streptomyces griseoaurantiacus TaxID=68213 RepID=A0A1G7VVI8_9ACTN|nr:helix-turn-helix domain-containing protein [Streptomyces jietaisiensis]SDG63792.1 Putative ATPase subunit of terminase (gpP-like) [Streptomyces jietaisiensis]